jgi:integrase
MLYHGSTSIKEISDQAGINDLRFHDLRHEATSPFFEMGFNIM